MRRLIFIVALMIIAAAPTCLLLAQSMPPSTAPSRERLERFERQMAEILDQLLDRTLFDEPRRKLEDAQAAWLTFRDKECTFEARQSVDDPMLRAHVDDCKARLTEDRSKQLLVHLTCRRDDASCRNEMKIVDTGSFERRLFSPIYMSEPAHKNLSSGMEKDLFSVVSTIKKFVSWAQQPDENFSQLISPDFINRCGNYARIAQAFFGPERGITLLSPLEYKFNDQRNYDHIEMNVYTVSWTEGIISGNTVRFTLHKIDNWLIDEIRFENRDRGWCSD